MMMITFMLHLCTNKRIPMSPAEPSLHKNVTDGLTDRLTDRQQKMISRYQPNS